MKKKRIWRFSYFVPVFYPFLDAYFRRMSRRGWRLVDYKKNFYCFERDMPDEREFFSFLVSYEYQRNNRFFKKYPDVRREFAMPRQYSKLNAATHYQQEGTAVLEIDPKKVDTDEYRELRRQRNIMYFLRLLGDIGLILLMFGIIITCILLVRD